MSGGRGSGLRAPSAAPSEEGSLIGGFFFGTREQTSALILIIWCQFANEGPSNQSFPVRISKAPFTDTRTLVKFPPC